MAPPEMDASAAHGRCEALLREIETAVIADREFFEVVLLGILSRDHVLLEEIPGTGKTLTARSFARAPALSFSAHSVHAGSAPGADVTGAHIYNEEAGSFEFMSGPIFANIVLAEEINRAPPKTQAAMLEAMGERQVTTENETRELLHPFLVIATQHPIGQEGTFPLPEAQMDRFLVKTAIGYSDVDGYTELLRRRAAREAQAPTVERILEEDDIEAMRHATETGVHVESKVLSYLLEIAVEIDRDHRVRVRI